MGTVRYCDCSAFDCKRKLPLKPGTVHKHCGVMFVGDNAKCPFCLYGGKIYSNDAGVLCQCKGDLQCKNSGASTHSSGAGACRVLFKLPKNLAAQRQKLIEMELKGTLGICARCAGASKQESTYYGVPNKRGRAAMDGPRTKGEEEEQDDADTEQ